MKLSLRRKFKGPKYTIGDLSIDGTFFCNTIEDVIRELPDSCPNTSRWIPCKCKEKVYVRIVDQTVSREMDKLSAALSGTSFSLNCGKGDSGETAASMEEASN